METSLCGIAGHIHRADPQGDFAEKVRRQGHRGPDDFTHQNLTVGDWTLQLAHQRLAIIDLSEQANQPYVRGQYRMSYNGEVYNYIELRGELEAEGITFKTDSDTEVVFESIIKWGMESACKKFNGMWAIAFIDEQEKKLQLSRDRFGIKPLYWSQSSRELVFSSEMKTLLSLAGRRFTLNHQVVGEHLSQHILEGHTSKTFFNEVNKVRPGTFLNFYLGTVDLKVKEVQYYSLAERVARSSDSSPKEILSSLEQSVGLRLRSDVPVGILLSGGIDSSAIAAICSKISQKEVKFLSYVSDDKSQDESRFVDIVSNHLGKPVEKIKIDIESEDIAKDLEYATYINDQPLHSLSAYAHFLLMKKAKDLGITVVLSGQGADEALCGYKKYVAFYVKYLVKKKAFLQLFVFLPGLIFNSPILRGLRFGDLQRYAPFLNSKNAQSASFLGAKIKKDYLSVNLHMNYSQPFHCRQVKDIESLSVPSLLHYEDRMSMCWSREIRVPFLDHNFVEKSLRLPVCQKIKNGWTKYVLRKAVGGLLPSSIVWRKDKKGFTNPQDTWLKNELSDSVKEIVTSKKSKIYTFGLVDFEALNQAFRDFQGGVSTVSGRQIFAPFALEMWLRVNDQYIGESN